MSTVNIVTSDRGWILEKLAGELASRLPYVTCGGGPDPGAAIQYYMTYGCRPRRLAPVEVAYFAHLEPDGPTRDRFFAVAREVEHCVCHAKLYEAVLRDAGIASVTTIPPGVDHALFRPKLRIGVVGRTYHTGRKGEHLVASVMDIPEIEWCFTGGGWPAPALDLPPERMPDLYRALDYVLVPSLYEGGPMCVAEALSSGTPVIAPPIGWVPDFPHHAFRAGDAADLRRVLLELVEAKRRLRATTLGHTWDAWAEGHDRLFHALAAPRGLTLAAPPPRPAKAGRARHVGVFLHGEEDRAQGGPSIRAPRLVRELSEAGVQAELRRHPDPRGFEGIDLVHVFNAWSPLSALDAIRRARQAGRAVVLSPIFLDLSHSALWEERLVQAFAAGAPGAAMDPALAAFRADLAAARAAQASPAEAMPGFHDAVREMAHHADRLILLSERERERLARIGAETARARIVRNPVDADFFGAADPALFRRHVGLSDFVLCVARLEPRKNQLMLVHALRDTGLPVVLVGQATHDGYAQVLERHATEDLRILGRLPAHSPLLASAYAAARVVALPSWAEGAPLAALEAAAAGARLVLSDESGESAYFGDLARYCDPGDPASIRAAVLSAWDDPPDAAARKARIAEDFGWSRHRAATEAVYAEALAEAAARPLPQLVQAPPARPRIVVDVTTTALRTGRWTGIARVEAALAAALAAEPEAELRLVAWHDRARGFVELPLSALRDGSLGAALAAHDPAALPPLSLPAGAHLLVAGSAWMQNRRYAEAAVALAKTHALRLVALIHDVIPARFPFWFEDGYAPVFLRNLALLLDGAEHVLAVSESTRRDLEDHAARTESLFLPPVSFIRGGDEIGQEAGVPDALAPGRLAALIGGRPFVLCIGAIHARKNHRLLYDVWLRLAARMGEACPLLVLVGGVAWNGQDVARALREDARLGGRVLILEGVDDGALDWLYRHCLFTAYPSLHEGWGLPVAESLRHGKLCLAADTSSVPEIAPGLVELLDPLDVVLWAAKIRFFAESRAARAAAEARIAAGYRPTPWAATARQLLDLLGRAPPRAAHPYSLGAVVPFSEPVMAARIQGPGWHLFEDWGAWAAAPRAELIFAPPLPPQGALLLVVEARAMPEAGRPFVTDVLVNDTQVARWGLPDGDLLVLRATIPAELVQGSAPIRVAFLSPSLVPLAEGGGVRQVGIGLAAASLAPLDVVRDAARYASVAGRAAQAVELGRGYDLLGADAGRVFLAGRWIANAAWGMFCAERRPRMEMLLPGAAGELCLTLRLRPVATAAAPLDLRLLAHGEEVAAWHFASDAPASLSVTIPAALAARAALLKLDFVAGEPRAPAALGLGVAAESAGFGLIGFMLHAACLDPPRARLRLAEDAPLRIATGQSPAEDGALRAALGPDWHAPEPGATWSFGQEALLPLRLDPPPRGETLLKAEIEGFRPAPDAALIGFEALAGETPLIRHAMRPGEARVVDIPVPAGAVGADGALDLRLRVDAVSSPFTRGEGQDERPLGFRIGGLRIARQALLEEGRPVRFGQKPGEPPATPDPADMLVGGWYAREEGGCWSHGEDGALLLAPAPSLRPGWRLFLACRTIGGTREWPARVALLLDGETLGHWDFTGTHAVIAEVPGLAARMAGRRTATLGLRRISAASPFDLGMGDDRRRLGVMLAAALVVGPVDAEERARRLLAGLELGLGALPPLAGATGTGHDRPSSG
ncbi:glycosyltransferase [Falsiroseomonas sp.]|uniref:glycosyltransferase n=1 Tax=Falsiroseomonas sp. TaxID=2870721 RepID=UPI0034A4C7C9